MTQRRGALVLGKLVSINHCSSRVFSHSSGAVEERKRLLIGTLCSATRSGNKNYVLANLPTRTVSSHNKPVKGRRCQEPACAVMASFDVPGGEGRYCRSHKQQGMKDVKNKLYPTFGFPGGQSSHCTRHKTVGMQDRKSKVCLEPGCTSSAPSFGLPGGSPTYCRKHKTAAMENVLHRKCQEPGCAMIRPSFDVPGGKGSYCFKHKKPSMIDVIHKRTRILLLWRLI